MWWRNQTPEESSNDFEQAREQLVAGLANRIQRDETAAALRAVPRHEFVPDGVRENAYADRPLPIGADQTISAPHMVAIMTDLLALTPGDRVLEIGSGCGYHAAVTAEIVGGESVYSVEYVPALASMARTNLAAAGYGAVSVRTGDGATGWPEHAPYDAAYATCAAPDLPDPILEQVRVDAPLLVPVGTRRQRLVLARKRADGSVDRTVHGGVRFVPMVDEE